MLRTFTATAIVLLVTAAGAALADSDRNRIEITPAVSRDAIQTSLEALGYEVRRVKFKHGAYQARIRERENGGLVRVVLDPATGRIAGAMPDH